jgi:hypothetical protein
MNADVYSDVEKWKEVISEEEYSKKEKSFRRNILSGGVLNFPDRPRKITKKYDGLSEDLRAWNITSYKLSDVIYGILYLIKKFYILRERLKFYKVKIIYKNIFDSKIGKPLFLIPKITEASIRYWYYANLLRTMVPEAKNIMEIGGGYGGLCRSILKLNKENIAYTIVDLPHNIRLTKYYLINNGIKIIKCPNERSTNESTVLLIESNKLGLDKFDEKYDIAINTMSFQHMTFSQIKSYLYLIRNLNTKFIYYLNRISIRDAGDTSCLNYPMDEKYKLIISNYWQGNDHLERLYKIIDED